MITTQSTAVNFRDYCHEEAYTAYIGQLKQRYEDTKFHILQNDTDFSGFMGCVKGLPNNFGLWMPGVALIAERLAKKKGVENLFVAKSMEAFVATLKVHLISKEVFRAAYIVSPIFSWCTLPKNFPQHKVTIVLEKTRESIKMAMLDSMPIGRQGAVDPQHLKDYNPEDFWEGYGQEKKFNGPELILRAFFKACDNLEASKEIYQSRVVRLEKRGCAIFALYDAIAFLKNPSFFSDIVCDEQVIDISEKNTCIRYISEFPPVYMRGTQSLVTLEAYKTRNEEYSEELQKYLNKTLVKISSPNEEKWQNHFITKKEIKNYTWLVNVLCVSTYEDVQKSLEKTLLK